MPSSDGERKKAMPVTKMTWRTQLPVKKEDASQKEDERAIAVIANEIQFKAGSMVCLVACPEGREAQSYIGVNENLMQRRKAKYAYYGTRELLFVLSRFFCSEYNCKMLARVLYWMDEGDIHVESIDCEIPLGKVIVDKQLVETSCAEIVIRKRKEDTRNPITGMPFDLLGVRLIPSEE